MAKVDLMTRVLQLMGHCITKLLIDPRYYWPHVPSPYNHILDEQHREPNDRMPRYTTDLLNMSHREVGGDISHGSVDRGFMDVRAGTMPNGAFFPSHTANDEIASSVSEEGPGIENFQIIGVPYKEANFLDVDILYGGLLFTCFSGSDIFKMELGNILKELQIRNILSQPTMLIK